MYYLRFSLTPKTFIAFPKTDVLFLLCNLSASFISPLVLTRRFYNFYISRKYGVLPVLKISNFQIFQKISKFHSSNLLNYELLVEFFSSVYRICICY